MTTKTSAKRSAKPQSPRGVVSTQNAAASAFKVSSKTISAWKAEGGEEAGFRPDGSVDLNKLHVWTEHRRQGRDGSIAGKEEKLLEEIRKLRLANDAKEGRLVERAWVAERIQRMFGDVNAFRAKSEAEHPTKFAAASGDVAHCRTIVRGIWDSVMSDLQSLKKHLEEAA